MPGLERIAFTRVVAAPLALSGVRWPDGAIVLPVAPDEAWLLGRIRREAVDDPDAIVEIDTGIVGRWMPAAEAHDLLERECEWQPPAARPSFAQGMVAGLPVKIWFETNRVLILVPAPYEADALERLR